MVGWLTLAVVLLVSGLVPFATPFLTDLALDFLVSLLSVLFKPLWLADTWVLLDDVDHAGVVVAEGPRRLAYWASPL